MKGRILLTLIFILSVGFTVFNSDFMPVTQAQSVYEAENFTAQSNCSVNSSNWPYLGNGYAQFDGSDAWAEWNNVHVASDGDYLLVFKYDNSANSNSLLQLYVNGRYVRDLTLKPSDIRSRANWKVARTVVSLHRGDNLVKLVSSTANSGLMLDNFAVSANVTVSPPLPVYDVVKYGAKGDGSTVNTAAIQHAIDACAGSGGSVYIHDGVYMTGTLELKSKMTLYIAESATLKGTANQSDYPDCIPKTNNFNWMATKGECGKGLIYCAGQSNITITGGGTIDGNSNPAVWTGPERTRPMVLYLTTSKNVKVTNIDISYANCWTFCPLEIDGLIVDGVNIQSTDSPNRDGIDPCDCHNVTIANSSIVSQDDGLCPKSGSAMGNDNFLVQNCTILSTSNPIKFGTASYQSFTNMTFQDVCIQFGSWKAGISLGISDGAKVDNVRFSNIRMSGLTCPLYVLNGAGARDRRPSDLPSHQGNASLPVGNITFENIDARNCQGNVGCLFTGTVFNGTTYRINGLILKNVSVNNKGKLSSVPPDPSEYVGTLYPDYNWFGSGALPAYGFYFRHANHVNTENVSFSLASPDIRQSIVENDVTAIDSPPPAPAPAPSSGVTKISNLLVDDSPNAAKWSIQRNIQKGDRLYGDREFAMTEVPPSIAGANWIRPANSSKTYTSDNLVTFTISQQAKVYVASDDRITTKPSWLSSWTNTGLQIADNESIPRTFTLYAKWYPAGTVSLGYNGNTTYDTYIIIVK